MLPNLGPTEKLPNSYDYFLEYNRLNGLGLLVAWIK